MKHARARTKRRGFATLLVFGVVVIGAFLVSMVQTSAYAQAAAGREALARVRAYWAARGGVEAQIARLEFDTQNPDTSDAFKVLDEMAAVAEGSVGGASYRVTTWDQAGELPGPADAHAKLNINALTGEQLLELEPFMTEDVAQAILDWIDADDDVNPQGAEVTYYQSLPFPYEPRNGPMRSIQEMELVAGVDPRDVRGEDWNLNGVLDANEDDGDASWPPDNADGRLDAGWSGVLTAVSAGSALTAGGEEKINLFEAEEKDLTDRLKVERTQAEAILEYVEGNPSAQLTDFILQDLNRLVQSVRQQQPGQQTQTRVEALTDEQLGLLLDEFTAGPASVDAVLPGRLNINTAPATVLEMLTQIPPEVADAIITERESRPEGFTSIVQLREVAGIGRAQLAGLAQLLTTRSSVYVVTSKGRDELTGIEVELVVTLDRSRLPVVIQEVVAR